MIAQDTAKDRQIWTSPIFMFVMNFVIIFIGYYMFFQRSITADGVTAYAVGHMGYDHFTLQTVLQSIAGGRWLAYLVCYFQSFIHIDWYENQWIAQLVKEIVCAIIPVRMAFLFGKRSEKSVVILDALFLMCTFNVYIEEMFAFNTMEICLGWLLAFEAAILFCREKYIVAGMLTFLAISVYQVNYCIVVIVGLGWLLSQNGFIYNKKMIRKCMYLLLVVAVPTMISMALPMIALQLKWTDTIVKLTVFDSKVLAESVDLLLNVKRLAGFVFAFFAVSAQGMMPYGMVGIFVILLYVIYVFEMKSQGERVVTIALSVVCVSLFFVACFAISVVQSIVSLPPRVLFGLFTAIAMLVYVIYSYARNDICRKTIRYATYVFSATLFVCVVISGIDHHTSNQLDIAYAQQIQNEIDAYEQDTGNTITDIKFYYKDDNYYDTAYSNYMIHHYFVQSYNNSVYTNNWSAVPMLEWISGRTYGAEELDEEVYREIFGDPTWTELDLNKQILFDGGTMYWAIYVN